MCSREATKDGSFADHKCARALPDQLVLREADGGLLSRLLKLCYDVTTISLKRPALLVTSSSQPHLDEPNWQPLINRLYTHLTTP